MPWYKEDHPLMGVREIKQKYEEARQEELSAESAKTEAWVVFNRAETRLTNTKNAVNAIKDLSLALYGTADVDMIKPKEPSQT